MDENEWLNATDSRPMLVFLENYEWATYRKLHLFVLACCRRVWPWLTDERSRRAVEAAEAYLEIERNLRPSERWLHQQELDKIWAAAGSHWPPVRPIEYINWAATKASPPGQEKAERQAQADLLREIFGNPFYPLPRVLSPSLLSFSDRTPVKLAREAYEHRRLPEGTLDPAHVADLADSLEEAGCDNHEILSHLRQPGRHYRGCWCIDLILGNS